MASRFFDRPLGCLASRDSRRALLSGAMGLLGASIPDLPSEAKKKKRCKGGAKRCGRRCTNLKTDSANCGACGTRCGTGRVCVNGVCGCKVGQSLVQGVCIPTFGCTAQTDTCASKETNCPQRPDLQDAFCFVTAEGEPFCGDITDCVNAIADCTPVNGKQRVLLSCPLCPDQGDIGICTLPVAA